jgi:hypothetical protein
MGPIVVIRPDNGGHTTMQLPLNLTLTLPLLLHPRSLVLQQFVPTTMDPIVVMECFMECGTH